MKRFLSWFTVMVIGVILTTAMHVAAGENDDPGEGLDTPFTVVLLPDTQIYSESFPDIFHAQTKWIVENADALNIKMVLHLGDVVNRAGYDIQQWGVAQAAMRRLDEAGVPTLIAPGNHDYDDDAVTRRTTLFNEYFGMDRYAGQPWFGGGFEPDQSENVYALMEIGGVSYLFMALEFGPRDVVLDWASEIIRSHPDHHIIVVTHSYMHYDNIRTGVGDGWNPHDYLGEDANDGDEMWHKFVRQHPNMLLVVNGHMDPYPSRRMDFGKHGNVVFQALSDWSSTLYGGGGYLRILTFHSPDEIDVVTYSPYFDEYKADDINQFTFTSRDLVGFSGVIRAADTGRPMPGVMVRLEDQNGKIAAVDRTYVDGTFGLVVPDGEYTFSVITDDEWFMLHSPADGEFGGCGYVLGDAPMRCPEMDDDSAFFNFAQTATVTTGSILEGSTVQALTDSMVAGDFGEDVPEWVSDGLGEDVWIRFEWAQPIRPNMLYLYGSESNEFRIGQVEVLVGYDDGNNLEIIDTIPVTFPDDAHLGVAVPLAGQTDVNHVEIKVKEGAEGAGAAGLTEAAVIGFVEGYVWISSPVRNSVLYDLTPIAIEGAAGATDTAHLKVTLDETVIYEGDDVPHHLWVNPADLVEGSHDVTIIVTYPTGLHQHYSANFEVSHVTLNDQIGTGRQSDTILVARPGMAADLYKGVTVTLDHINLKSPFPTGVRDEGPVTEKRYVALTSDAFSSDLYWNTLELADGPYELTVKATTVGGITTSQSTRFIIENREVLDDPLEPPQTIFHLVMDRIKAVERSDGWAYVGNKQNVLFGDADRIVKSGNGAEYLVWRMPNLERFELVFYGKDKSINERIGIELSADGQMWYPVPYTIEARSSTTEDDAGWYRLGVTGNADPISGAQLIRITIAETLDDTFDDVELGHVRLVGWKNP